MTTFLSAGYGGLLLSAGQVFDNLSPVVYVFGGLAVIGLTISFALSLLRGGSSGPGSVMASGSSRGVNGLTGRVNGGRPSGGGSGAARAAGGVLSLGARAVRAGWGMARSAVKVARGGQTREEERSGSVFKDFTQIRQGQGTFAARHGVAESTSVSRDGSWQSSVGGD